MASVNDNVFKSMMDATFSVNIDRDGKTLPLTCRRIPFTTLMAVIADVAVSARDEIARARRAFIDEIIIGGVNQTLSKDKVRETIMPIIMTALAQAPELAQRILVDVVIGCTADTVRLFTVEDTLAVLEEAIKREDVNKIAEKAQSVFSTATEMLDKAVSIQADKDAKVEAQTSPSQS